MNPSAERQIVGIDCAAQDRNVGVAVGAGGSDSGGAGCTVLEAATRLHDPVEWILERVDWDRPVILALDAPLGWPVEMARRLGRHAPGEALDVEANHLFRRRTDHEVRARTGKVPLDVGADRIARAAHGALGVLARLRRRSGRPLPLLWEPPGPSASGVIEVYPAATLRQWQWPDRGYKGKNPSDCDTRRVIVGRLGEVVELSETAVDNALEQADTLDAVLCVLAAVDFLGGRCPPAPDDAEVREQEGWMWVRS
ncbi:MAG: DUF429 domain-containing protein [Gemmatimonadetes bacterium]|nr:DUF429 domain-containing protein [Gemmatimonadota bacterium]